MSKSKFPPDLFTSLSGFYGKEITGKYYQKTYVLLTEYSGGKFKKEITAKIKDEGINGKNYLVLVFDKEAIFTAFLKNKNYSIENPDDPEKKSKKQYKEYKNKLFDCLWNKKFQPEEEQRNDKPEDKNIIKILDTYDDEFYLFFICDYTDCPLPDFLFDIKDSLFLEELHMEPILHKPILDLFEGMHRVHENKKILSVLLDPNEMYVKKDKNKKKVIFQFKDPELVKLLSFIKVYTDPDQFPPFLHNNLYKLFDDTPPEEKNEIKKEEEIEPKKEGNVNPEEEKKENVEKKKRIVDLDEYIQKYERKELQDYNNDFWSFGNLAYYIIFGEQPFNIKCFQDAKEKLDSKEAEFKMNSCYITELMEKFISDSIDSKIVSIEEEDNYNNLRKIFKKQGEDTFIDDYNYKVIKEKIIARKDDTSKMGLKIKVTKNKKRKKVEDDNDQQNNPFEKKK